ncbi:hypothetical protein [Duganella sp. CF517]|uniref:hypothetical protein n=1 Tax=Duganella sp. CF517 TaxID=1881038 RepID=UPI0011608C1F|nr:hypothetical protein [Duganella sp. CF517]
MIKLVFVFLFLSLLASNSYATQDYFIKVYLDKKNNVHVISSDGIDRKVTSDGRLSGVKISPDTRTVIWLVLNIWIAEGDVIPGGSVLAIYQNGKLRHIKCEPFIRDYWFWSDGRQIAIDCGGRHFAGTLILYDAVSLRKLDSISQSDVPEEKRPEWAK